MLGTVGIGAIAVTLCVAAALAISWWWLRPARRPSKPTIVGPWPTRR